MNCQNLIWNFWHQKRSLPTYNNWYGFAYIYRLRLLSKLHYNTQTQVKVPPASTCSLPWLIQTLVTKKRIALASMVAGSLYRSCSVCVFDSFVYVNSKHKQMLMIVKFLCGAVTLLGMSITYFGWVMNLIVFLIEEFNIKSIAAVQISNIVNGVVNMLPVVAAILADSFFGNIPVISASAFISLTVSFNTHQFFYVLWVF